MSAVQTSNGTTDGKQNSQRSTMEIERKRAKETFLIFTRVLMKYLEQKDPPQHQKVQAIIKDCAERNRRQERGYESVTASMKTRLKEVVDEAYWKRAEAYLHHFLQQKAKTGGSSSLSKKSGSSALSSSDKMRQQQQKSSSGSNSSNRPPVQSSSQQHMNQQQSSSGGGGRTSQPQSAQAIANLRKEISTKRQALGSSSGSGSSNKYSSMPPPVVAAPTTAAPATAVSAYSSKGKGQSAAVAAKGRGKASSSPVPVQRKTSTVGAPVPTAMDTKPVEVPVTREYSEFMEMVDHAVNYDWTTAGMLLGSKTHAHLSEEQRNLLYSEYPSSSSSETLHLPSETSFPLPGWGEHNAISPRVAWARLRLREQKMEAANPVVADGLLTLAPPKSATGASGAVPATAVISKATAWLNEDRAEEDQVLAVLSEGVQIYLKSVLEKALHCARQRQNVDGIRLWHQQLVPGSKPPLSLRLGCDVTRQISQALGNAAMTCKRMEEALSRQSGMPADYGALNEETLSNAQSMSDLALRPKLAKGAENADFEAKRSFEVYGGKHSLEPPLGRVPKQAKLEVVDFQMGMNLAIPGRHRASTAASSFFF